jgi:hypothetical protein
MDTSKACVIAQESGMNDHEECRGSNWCGCECHGPLIGEEQHRSMQANPEYWESRTGRTNLW